MKSESHQSVPIWIKEGLILTTVLINGKEATFLVDSGAPTIIINKAPTEGKALQNFEGVGGSGQHDTYTIDTFRWCGLNFENLTVPSIDLSHLENEIGSSFYGLIGYEQLKNHSFKVDYAAELFHLWSEFDENEFTILDSFPFEMKVHAPIINMEIENLNFQMALDTGAAANLMDVNLRNKLKSFISSDETDELVGADKSSQTVEQGDIPSSRIGSTEFKNMATVWSKIEHLQQAFGPIDGLLGYEFLKHKSMIVSYPRNIIFITD